jgi:branched-chain amino acid transport system ATP-binding protein
MSPVHALELQQLRKNFGLTSILQGIDLTIASGERHAIIGPNGAGKSTLFDVISGRTWPTSGTILLNGRDATTLPPHRMNRLGLSRSFQISSVFHRLSVFDNVLCAALYGLGYRYSFWHRLPKLLDARSHVEQILELIGLHSRRDLQAGLLTYADQRRLEIGLTIAGGADVILLDEPTAGMSRSESDEAVDLIRRVTAGKTLVVIEHDMDVVFGLADRISVLVYGKVIASAPPAEIRSNKIVQEAYLGRISADKECING